MPAKVNIVLDDDVKADLERMVASGLRSRVVNRALRRELLRLHRGQAAQTLDRLRSQTGKTSTAQIVRALRSDRGRS